LSRIRERLSTTSWLVVLTCLLATAWAHRAFMDPPVVVNGFDEGYIVAFAQRMIDGRWLPYVDAVSHRGPLLYWLAAVASAVAGPYSWLGVRVLSLVVMAVTVLFTFLAARAAGRPFVGAVGALTVTITATLIIGPFDGLSYNGEHLLNAFAVMSLYFMTRGLEPRDAVPRHLFAAGLCAALGVLSKQNAAVTVLGLGLWLLSVVATRGLGRARGSRLLAVFSAGCLLPLFVTVGCYGLAGELDALWYWTVRYNTDVYMAFEPGDWATAARRWVVAYTMHLVVGASLVLWGLARPFEDGPRNYFHRWARAGFTPTVACIAGLTMVVANATMRGFGHYYIQVVPWVGLLLGLFIDAAFERRAQLARALVMTPAIVLMLLGWRWSESQHRRAGRHLRKAAAPLCQLIDQHSQPHEAIFVWGFRPDLYTICQRRSASKYVFTSFVAGFVPWFSQTSVARENELSVPGSRAELIAELEAGQTALIIDHGESLARRPMTRYPELAAYLEDHYCFAGHFRQTRALVRWREGSLCKPVRRRTGATVVVPLGRGGLLRPAPPNANPDAVSPGGRRSSPP